MAATSRTARVRAAAPQRPAAGFSPGIVAGASDNDPTTVATLAVVGAQTGFSLAWVVVLLFPMLATVQAVASAVGVATGRGLQQVVAGRFGRRVAALSLCSLVVVNVLTLVADLEGGAAAVGLLLGAPWRWFVVPLAAGVAAVLGLCDQAALRRVLSVASLLFVAYVPAAFLAHPAWGQVLLHSLVPSLVPTRRTFTDILALMGTTLTAYVYVWQTIEEREHRGTRSRRTAQRDAVRGMAAASMVFWFILVATGATLGQRGQEVRTAGDAAAALRGIAGPLSSSVFAVGLLASAVLAIAVLAMTTAHAVADTLHPTDPSRDGPSLGIARLRVLLPAALLLASLACLADVPPVDVLVAAGIAGGLATPFTMVLLLLVARDRRCMGDGPIGQPLAAGATLTIAAMSSASLLGLWTSLHG